MSVCEVCVILLSLSSRGNGTPGVAVELMHRSRTRNCQVAVSTLNC